MILAALGLTFGLAPGLIEWSLVAPMVEAVSGGPMESHLALWHGLGPAFILSLVTFAIGILLYLVLDPIRAALEAAEPRLPRTEAWYEAVLAAVAWTAAAVTDRVQNGRMTSYLRNAFLAFAVLTWGALALGSAAGWPRPGASVELIDWVMVGIIVASVVVALRTNSRLTAICALGGIGAAIAMIFVLYGAIDVAMTQLFVEVLVVVFLAVAMVRLPRSGGVPFHAGNAAVALLLGAGVSLALLSVLATDPDLTLSSYFAAKSVPEAYGHNIVNVILVDFRGLDTMGEISVILVAGIAAIAVLRAGRKPQ